MSECKISELEVKPFFELEDYMNLAGESRMETSAMNDILSHWEVWLAKLKVQRLEAGGNSWVAAWLPDEVELEVDERYSHNPAQGHWLNTLAAYLCSMAIAELMPAVAAGGCAPAPEMTPDLAGALRQAGVAHDEGDRRYSVITYYPFKGGCEICQAREGCPKMGGGEAFASMVLPGYERGAD